MAKALNELQVNLAFTADTSKAKAQLQDLQQALQKITQNTGSSSKFGLTKEINEAAVAAAKLQQNLHAATNQDTGKLDLGRFIQQMNQSGMSLQKYQQKLSALGPEGEKAFAKLAQSVTLAEIPLRRSSGLLTQFKTTLMNTARWQISSSVLHGFMGAIQHAYGYAQDLNESLNNIRIITGQSTDEMAAFAEKANTAAQALSTTTLKYTDAALIYYRQGLRGEDVTQRADTTIKLMNVAGSSAETASEQMTAVWQNFYDGSKSLEYYADVMAKLGATTASSTDEIATGLQKFAAVANTVGLSYEYATSALATITAQTRQSADIVGTALKTLFARIQDLELGKTLEDGTDLGKYSQALMKVGINIKDVNGEVKNMDTLLDEMGEKWNTLAKDQQIALAQNVAGTRQYTQLVALMDNWDFMKKNLDTAKGAEGELQRQADIYAESWEAAKKRVQAAAEDIYSALLDDKFFIGLNNGFATVLKGINQFIDSIGGLKGVLLTLGAIATTVFQKNIANGISNMGYSLMMMTQKGQNKLIQQKQEASQLMANQYADKDTAGGHMASEAYEKLAVLQSTYAVKAREMTEAELEYNASLVERGNLLTENIAKIGESVDKAKQEENISKNIVTYRLQQVQNSTIKGNVLGIKLEEFDQLAQKLANIQVQAKHLPEIFENLKFPESLTNANIESVTQKLENFEQQAKQAGISLDPELVNHINQFKNTTDPTEKQNLFSKIKEDLANLDTKLLETEQQVAKAEGEIDGILTKLEVKYPGIIAQVHRYMAATVEAKSKEAEGNVEKQKTINILEELKNQFQQASQTQISFGQAMSKTFSLMMSSGMIITQVSGLVKTLGDDTVPVGQKITQLLMTLGMVGPMVISSVIPAIKSLTNTITIFGKETSLAMWQLTLIIAVIAAVVGSIIALKKYFDSISPEGKLKRAKETASQLATALDEAKSAAQELNSAFDSYDSAVDKLENCAKGTQEWYAALREVNNEVLELIDKYPELVTTEGFIETTVDGIMRVTKEGRDYLQQMAQDAVSVAQIASISANQDVRQKQQNVYEHNIEKDLRASYRNNMMLEDEEKAEIKDQIINMLSDFEGMSEDQVKEKLQTKFDDLTLDFDALASDVVDLSNAVRENTTAKQTENKALTAQALSDNEKIQNSDYREDIINATSKSYETAYQEALNNLNESGWGTKGISKFTGVNDEAQRVWDQYLEAAKLSKSEYKLTDTTGTDDNRNFKYNANGQDQTITLDAMKEIVAASQALEALGKSAETVTQNLTALFSSTKEVDQAFGKFLANDNLDKATKGQFQALASGEKTTDEWAVELGFKSVLEMAKAYGYDSAEEFYVAFNEAIGNARTAWEDVGLGIRDASGEWTKDLSLEMAQKLEDVFDVIDAGPAGHKAGQDFSKALTEVLSQLDVEDQQKALEQILSIDWADPGAWQQFQDIISSFNEDIDLDTQAWLNFAEAMAIAAGAQPDFTNLSSQLGELTRLLNGVDFGDTMKKEDADKLIEAGKAIGQDWSGMFQAIDDQTVRFTGNVKDMQMSTREWAKTTKEDLAEVKELQDNFKDANWQAGGKEVDWSNTEGLNKVATLKNLSNSDSAMGILEKFNYNDSQVEAIANNLQMAQDMLDRAGGDMEKLTDSQKDYYDEVVRSADRIFQDISNFMSTNVEQETELIDQMTIAKAETMGEAWSMYESGEVGSWDATIQQIEYLGNAALQSATSFDQLKSVIAEAEQYGAELQYDIYSEKLIELASNYDNCTQEINKYNQALKSGEEGDITAAETDLQASLLSAENAQAYGFDPEVMEDMTDSFGKMNKELSEGEGMLRADAEAAADAATRYMRLNEAVDDIYDNYDKYKEVLEDVSKETEEWGKAEVLASKNGQALKKSLAGLLDTSEDLIDAKLVDAINPEDFEKAAMGDANAIQNIRDAFIDAQVEALNLADSSGLEDFKNKLANLNPGEALDLDTTKFAAQLAQAALEAGMTASEIESMLSGFGIDCDVTPFDMAMAEAEGAAADAAISITESGDAIVAGGSIDAEINEVQSTSTDTEEDTEFDEVSWPTVQTATAHVMENEKATSATPVTTSMVEWHKTVRPRNTQETSEKQTTAQAIKLSNAHKSAGGNVGTTHQNSTPPGGGGGSCFAAGTLISTWQGFKNIEDIQIGDLVLSYNEKTGENEYSEVLQTMIHNVSEKIYNLYIEDEKLVVTGIHRFMIYRNDKFEWINASNLKTGDLVFFADKTLHKIDKVNVIKKTLLVYNFEVSNNHNYYVGKNQILAHNKGGGCFVAGTPISLNHYFKNIEDIQIGDYVLSYNELTKRNEYSKVVQTMIHCVYDNIYTLYINNEKLVVTGIHKFLIMRNGKQKWIPASDLIIGDLVLFANGTLHKIDDIKFEIQLRIVYNFEVSGNHNYYVGKNQILAHNKGGGGGKQKQTKKATEAKPERYHVIDKKLDDQKRKSEETTNKKELYAGQAKHKWALQEIKDLQKTIDLNKEKLKQIETWLKIDKEELEKYGKVQYDANGEIKNYEQLWEKNYQEYVNAVETWNASAQDEAADKALEAAEEKWDKFQKALEQYEETNQLKLDYKVTINDQELQKYLLKTEDNIYQIDFRLEFDERSKNFIDYMIDKINKFNKGLNSSAQILTQLGKQSKVLTDESNTITTGVEKTLRHYLTDMYTDKNGKSLSSKNIEKIINRFENNELTKDDLKILKGMPEEELENLFKAQEEIIAKNQEIFENMEAVTQELNNFWDKALEKMEDAEKPLEQVLKGIEHYTNIVDIVGQDFLNLSNELMNNVGQQRVETANVLLSSSKSQLDMLQDGYNDVLALYNNAVASNNKTLMALYEEQLKEIGEKLEQATEEYYERLEDVLQSAREEFEAAIERSKQTALDALAGPNHTWDSLKDALDYSKDIADNYVPVYKEIYELSKLNRDIMKSINDTDNIKNKEALRDLQKEINKLEEDSGKISEYDLENARRQYELTLARLQLEEAQQVKDIVRLSKDNEGNWSYIYTANEEDVAAAEQNYEDKLFAMQKANEDYINKLQEDLTNHQEEYIEKFAEIKTLYEEGTEEYVQAMRDLEEWHTAEMDFFGTEQEKVFSNNQRLYNEDWTWYSDFTKQKAKADSGYTDSSRKEQGYRLADTKDYVMNFNQTALGVATGYNTMDTYAENSNKVAQEMSDQMSTAYKIYSDNVHEAMERAGTSVENFGKDAQKNLDAAKTKTEAAEKAIDKLATNASKNFDTLVTKTKNWADTYGKKLDEMATKNEKLAQAILKVNNAVSKLDDKDDGTDNKKKTEEPKKTDDGDKNKNNNGNKNNNQNKEQLALNVAKDIWVWDDTGQMITGWNWSTGTGGLIDRKLGSGMGAKVQAYLNQIAAGAIYVPSSEWNALKAYHAYNFDTGGYTGDWTGKDGRLAFLHAKELVLNADDTKNILSAVDMVRKISDMISISAKTSEITMGAISAVTGGTFGMGQLEQSVHITAEFPNAKDRNEIEAAFEQLINEASQYANRKR